jgi:hypothetical protein
VQLGDGFKEGSRSKKMLKPVQRVLWLQYSAHSSTLQDSRVSRPKYVLADTDALRSLNVATYPDGA